MRTFRDALGQNAGLIRGGKGLLYALQVACAVHFFFEYIGGPRICSGPSMLPTMGPYNEWVLEDRLTIRLAKDPLTKLKRGDLVVATSPIDPSLTICKRILGLPGDVVAVDPFAKQESRRTEHVYIPDGHLWLVGDNASLSRDSRTYGPVSVGLVRGKLRASLYPHLAWYRNPYETLNVDQVN